MLSCGQADKKAVAEKLLPVTKHDTISKIDCASRNGLTGNNIFQQLPWNGSSDLFYDPIDDTIHFHYVSNSNRIYTDSAGKVYVLTYAVGWAPDCKTFYQFLKDYSDFISLKTFKVIKEDYFTTNGKVYVWFFGPAGDYPEEIPGADPKTFEPFDSVCGGKDIHHVFYLKDRTFDIIKDANPSTIKVLNPERGCWDCGVTYFVDNDNVYYGYKRIEGADAKTFHLVNSDKVDAADKRNKYFEGQITYSE